VPSARHEGILMMFRERPALALELMATCLGIEAIEPGRSGFTTSEVRVIEASATELPPVERRADLVLLVESAPESPQVQSRAETTQLVVVVEVQLRRDATKPRRWTLYAAMLGDRHRCPVELLVVTPSAAVAAWAETPTELSPGRPWWPRVLGPNTLPRLDAEAARAHPELAVLSALAHARAPDAATQFVHAAEALVRAPTIEPSLRVVYHDLMLAALPEAVREELSEMVARGRYEFQSDFAREHIERGRQEGRDEGRREGLETGREAGRSTGKLELLLAGLERRGVRLSPDDRERLATRAPERLDEAVLALVDGADARAVLQTLLRP
jgi:Arc/MetJ-type ribon-helix-helix transcriptional regulator